MKMGRCVKLTRVRWYIYYTLSAENISVARFLLRATFTKKRGPWNGFATRYNNPWLCWGASLGLYPYNVVDVVIRDNSFDIGTNINPLVLPLCLNTSHFEIRLHSLRVLTKETYSSLLMETAAANSTASSAWITLSS